MDRVGKLERSVTKLDPTTAIALKMAPTVLAKLGQAQENTVKAVCDAVKTIGCKDQIALTDAIHAIGPECAAISAQFVKVLNDSVHVYLQSSCKNYELIVEAVVTDPDTSIKDKVEYVRRLEASRAEDHRKLLTTLAGAFTGATSALALLILALQASKISGDHVKIVQAMEKTKQGKNLLEFIAKLLKKGT